MQMAQERGRQQVGSLRSCEHLSLERLTNGMEKPVLGELPRSSALKEVGKKHNPKLVICCTFIVCFSLTLQSTAAIILIH